MVMIKLVLLEHNTGKQSYNNNTPVYHMYWKWIRLSLIKHTNAVYKLKFFIINYHIFVDKIENEA